MLAMAGSSQFITQYAGKLLQVDNKRNNMRWCKKKKKKAQLLWEQRLMFEMNEQKQVNYATSFSFLFFYMSFVY